MSWNSWSARKRIKSVVAGSSRRKQTLRIVPAFFRSLGIEPLHGALPFWVELGELPELRGGTKPAGLDILGIPPVGLILRRLAAKVPGCPTRPQALDEPGHA